MKNTLDKPVVPHFRIPKEFLPDQDILTLVKNGDIEAFDIFTNRYKNRLMNYVFHFLHDYKLSLNNFREAIILRDIEGMSYSDISVITHVPVKKVKYRVDEARMKLNDYIT